MSPSDQGNSVPVFMVPSPSPHLGPAHDIATTIELIRGVFESLTVLIVGSVVIGLVAALLTLAWRSFRKTPLVAEEDRQVGPMRRFTEARRNHGDK